MARSCSPSQETTAPLGRFTSQIVPPTLWKQVPQAVKRGRGKQVPQAVKRGRGISTTALVRGKTVQPLDKGRFARERRGQSSSAISIVNTITEWGLEGEEIEGITETGAVRDIFNH